MSAVDVIFVSFYILCGLVIGKLVIPFGPIYGLVGFVVGFAIPMTLWRFIAPRLGRKRPSQKRSEDVDKRETKVDHDT
jgi:membrane protein implicated in regulation of membrane protease activity